MDFVHKKKRGSVRSKTWGTPAFEGEQKKRIKGRN